MGNATVKIPIVGFMVVGVEDVQSEEHAIEKALEGVDGFLSDMAQLSGALPFARNVFEWEWGASKKLSSGNINHFDCNEAEVEHFEEIDNEPLEDEL